jgi:hypothetical protein
MDAPAWVYASIVAVTVFHLFVLLYLRARRPGSAATATRPPANGDATGDADAGSADGDTVRCRQCGAENQRRFRFCRNCVAELPGASLAAGAGGASRPGIM